MSSRSRAARLYALASLAFSVPGVILAQSNSGSVTGTVTDPSQAVVAGATVTLQNPVSGLSRTTITDSSGHYQFGNLPFDSYRITATASGFGGVKANAGVRTTVPVSLPISLKLAGTATTVTVQGENLNAISTNLETTLDRHTFEKVPLESQSSALSSLVTLSSPGVSADSNGLFHGLGDHASNSFSIDGQPVTDQQSKVFSNQLPVNAVQSIKVISGAPPAEYGDKTSLIIDVTTRSGQGVTKPTGDITSSYGSFGSANGSVDVAYGGPNGGNFFELDGLDTGRFLDGPEFTVFHDKGNEQNVFDRIDRNFTPLDAIHLNLNYSRSWFQTPNAFDNLNVQNVVSGGTGASPVFADVGDADQHSKIETFDIAPTYTRILGANSVFNFAPFVRKDAYNYYPSGNPLADLGPPNLQTSSISQERTLLNAGVHADITYVRGVNDFKLGARYEQTFLREHDNLGIVDPTYSLSAPCADLNGTPLPGYSNPGACPAGTEVNPTFNPVLLPYDLTRGGSFYSYFGHTDVKELALYIEDQIKAGNWLFNLGMRGDFYNGLTVAHQAEPRLGLAYTVPRTSTTLRLSYARTLETPFNENLVLSSEGCSNAVLSPLLSCSPGVSGTLQPGFRNEFHAGLQQTFGKHVVFSGEYIWKYTHNAFDFSVLGNTPITFPIDWHNSKIPGVALRTDLLDLHNFNAYVVMSSVAARFFPPQVAGAGATVGQSGYPFRIDHDERFNQTTHLQYQLPGSHAPWIGFNWHFDSGQVAGSVPCYNPTSNDPNSACGDTSTLLNGQPAVILSGLTADEQFEAGLTCNGVKATPTAALPAECLASQYTSNLVSIPAPGTGDNDHNPQRIQSRSLFDASVGDDNLFKSGDRYRWSMRLTGVNIANKYALYNFLSTFSGTHYVTPRALTAQVGFHF